MEGRYWSLMDEEKINKGVRWWEDLMTRGGLGGARWS
jgi:hypothetical protein